MPRRISRRHRQQMTAELNITAFMNLMVVLVPFLLITAVFSQVTILKMNLPSGESQPEKDPKKPPLVLELIFTPTELIINDRNTGPLSVVKKTNEGYDFKQVNTYLTRVKVKFPDVSAITILSQEETTYDDIIQAMDAVRYTEQVAEGSLDVEIYELFPAISIGSAPIDTVKAGRK